MLFKGEKQSAVFSAKKTNRIFKNHFKENHNFFYVKAFSKIENITIKIFLFYQSVIFWY